MGDELTSLLISVRNVSEALVALKGGADILDVKNPAEGSLGANFPWVIAEIKRVTRSAVPISAAIGDFPNLPGSAALAAFGALNAGADIVKIGLKGPRDKGAASYLVEQVVKAVKNVKGSAKVVVCAYGDYKRAGTIDPASIPEITGNCGADVAMVDTAIKDGRALTDFLSIEDLKAFVEDAHSRGVWAALAGSLGFEEVRALKDLNPEVIGVRGAVCAGGDRKATLSLGLVRRLKRILEA